MLGLALAALVLAAPPKVASPPWNVVDLKSELAAFYAEQLAGALRAEGVQVSTADDFATLLGAERQRALLGCTDAATACLVELANALGCEATLTVSLARLGGGFRGTAKLMRSSDATVLSTVKLEARDEATLLDRLEAAAKVLAAPLLQRDVGPAPGVSSAAPAGGARRLWWLPGAVGVIGLGVGAGLFAATGSTYERLRAESDAAAARGLVTTGEGLQVGALVATGVGVAGLLTAASLLLFAPSDARPAVAVTLTPAGAHFALGGHF